MLDETGSRVLLGELLVERVEFVDLGLVVDGDPDRVEEALVVELVLSIDLEELAVDLLGILILARLEEETTSGLETGDSVEDEIRALCQRLKGVLVLSSLFLDKSLVKEQLTPLDVLLGGLFVSSLVLSVFVFDQKEKKKKQTSFFS